MASELISTNTSFILLGDDSISARQVMARCRSDGVGSVAVQDVLKTKGFAALASLITNRLQADGKYPSRRCSSGFPPFSRGLGRFNQSSILQPSRRVLPTDMANAITTVVDIHSMLRARFHQDRSTGVGDQSIVPREEVPGFFETHHPRGTEEMAPIMKATEKRIDIRQGPVFIAVLLEMEGKQDLHLTAHHLVVDLVSWRISSGIWETSLNDCQQLQKPPLSFQAWLKSRNGVQKPPCSYDNDTELVKGEENFSEFGGLGQRKITFGDAMSRQFRLSKGTTETLLTSSSSNNAYRVEP
ncbi:uncharacterized protein BCR38DRAFT_487635 [Pseudomassariella vexata]|uniref:Condensation domain-containing protein n=1 Tax=Pseudomassariella vexata TaxID=1141098 RepID=A0A1Y2DN41_9PEZI|nr:uncharacterized protein BCR38DRAFT_487635 [Pseudomassariella vexata]ORY60574.1 hypothetical protein BCR38DRAFT_487635 [Pseudomassariella vexata]